MMLLRWNAVQFLHPLIHQVEVYGQLWEQSQAIITMSSGKLRTSIRYPTLDKHTFEGWWVIRLSLMMTLMLVL